jgi:ATP-dependent exoDNAse (exonuclease V) alpha subunit
MKNECPLLLRYKLLASFLSTSQVLAITKLATKENAQVVNLGDGKQLSGVEAGKPFIISQQKKYGLTTIKIG